MTHSPAAVRATARVGAVPAPPAQTRALTLRRRPGYLGPVHIVQIMLVEAVIAGALVASGHGVVAGGTAVAAGILLLIAALTRSDGRWWLERRAMSWRFRRRNASTPVRSLADGRVAAMQFLAPGLTVDDIDAPDGSRVGVAADGAGWYATAAVGVGTPAADDGSLPLDRLVAALADPDQCGRAVLQVVTHTVPVPESSGAAGDSYRAVLRRHGTVPADRATWITVRLDAGALADMGADAPDQAPAAVVALIRHLAKTLRRHGVAARVLDREGLLDALARSCDLAVPGATTLADPHEEWDAWYSGRCVHRTFWVREWPAVARSGLLLDGVAAAGVLSSVAVVIAPRDGEVDLRCLIRVAATPHRIDGVTATVAQHASAAGARLLALDGEQGPAAYATAPTGGGPS